MIRSLLLEIACRLPRWLQPVKNRLFAYLFPDLYRMAADFDSRPQTVGERGVW